MAKIDFFFLKTAESARIQYFENGCSYEVHCTLIITAICMFIFAFNMYVQPTELGKLL